jgi:hypothetical protein
LSRPPSRLDGAVDEHWLAERGRGHASVSLESTIYPSTNPDRVVGAMAGGAAVDVAGKLVIGLLGILICPICP